MYYKITRTAERGMNMKVGYVHKRTAATSYYCNYLMKQGVEEVIVDNGNHELLSDLLNRMQPGDSFYVLGFDHISRNLNKLKEILETLYQKGILLFMNGYYVDFDDALIKMELEYYFQRKKEKAEE